MKIYLDGKFVDKKDAKISVFDHGLLYGDGVFEGIRAYNGRVFKFDAHIKRLYDSAKSMLLSIPTSQEEMKKSIIESLKINGLKDAYIRVVVTRGVGDLGMDPLKCSKPTIFIISDKIALYPESFYKNGLEIITASTRKNSPQALNPMIKSLNYLNNIFAKIEATNNNVLEALMLDKDGYVTECTGDNIFIYKNERLYTPPVSVGILQGITRDIVISIAREQGMEVIEELFTCYDIHTAEESFLTGTAAEIIPVVKLDNRVIGTGKPGRMTLELIKKFKDLTQSEGTLIK